MLRNFFANHTYTHDITKHQKRKLLQIITTILRTQWNIKKIHVSFIACLMCINKSPTPQQSRDTMPDNQVKQHLHRQITDIFAERTVTDMNENHSLG